MTKEFTDNIEHRIKKIIQESSETVQKSQELVGEIRLAADVIVRCFRSNNMLFIFGNGGSAADAQHLAAELIGRFRIERKSYPAVALTTDSSILTSLSNDYSFDIVFSRQCNALVKTNDVVMGISTSGNSKNVMNGLEAAKEKGAKTIALLGNDGGTIKDITDISIIVKSNSTPRIQEVHRTIIHIICELVENEITNTHDQKS